VLNAKAGAVIKAESPVDKGVPEAFSVSLDAEEIKAVQKGKKKPEKFHVGIMKIQDDFFLSSSPNIGVNGSLVGYRDVSVSVKNDAPFNLNVDGSVGRNFLDLKVSDIQISPRVVLDSLGIDLVKIYKGLAVGGFELKGSPMNPSFHGQIDIPNAEFNFPNFFKKRASTPMVSLIMSGSQFYTEPTRCHLQGQPIDVTVNVQMNRLAFESLDVRVQTIGNEYVPLNLNLSEMHVKGDFLADMTISLENDTIGVSGELTAKNANAEFGATRLNEIVSGLKLSDSDDDDDDGFPVDVSLRIKTGPRVQISYTTFLRAVVVPGSEIEVTYIGEDKRLLLDGEVPIRSGEIVYLNSSFYIKEGEIHFSDDDESFDPSISIVAECKTRDEDSEPVTITLSVEKQHLSNLKPRLSASPAKSEREIMEILGGIITANADSAAAFALATGDYAIQTVVIRRLENALRDFFNFDIFSVRTMVVQNAVKQSVRNSSGSGNLAGNYLDGTTVYIGKYFGDTLFADAMLRLDYDKNRVNNDYAYDGIAFKPEVGFELAAPFAKIRWSVSPDLESILNMKIVENTALTLSWKFNF
ncbi:MAG: translocation/assembly module TamB domain-containing protein, partial [Treponema sp.]|nr:translocation/assembly module TamB domain-containing protein [Treponema sp.]